MDSLKHSVSFKPYFPKPKVVIRFCCWLLNLNILSWINLLYRRWSKWGVIIFRQHPLVELNGISMCLFKVRSWNDLLEHFVSDKIYSTYPSLFCFTETNIKDSPAKHIDEIWVIEKTSIWLALCHNVSKINVIEVIDIPSVLEVL